VSLIVRAHLHSFNLNLVMDGKRNKPTRIIIVEDEMIIAANISLQVTNLGYEVQGIYATGEEVIASVRKSQPDLILMDINLKGGIDGIETAKLIQENYNIPIIYLTANSDDEHFTNAKSTHPQAFISKPFNNLDLKRSIELAFTRLQYADKVENNNLKNTKITKVLHDSIFIKNQERLIKIPISDILYIEAERNYCRIFTKGKEYLLVTTLKEMDEKLPVVNFIRIHRSFIINIAHIDEVAISYVAVAKKTIPLSKSFREDLLNRLQTI
jgi:DNA-binding LytR/AlgR family response regulator